VSIKRYPGEFKVEAVKQVVNSSHSISGVAIRLGITTQSFHAWIKRHGPDFSTPQNDTNAVSFFMRSGLSPAIVDSVAAVSGPTPNWQRR
jgi:transposase